MFLLYKKPEYRKFNLKPRYWDPEKEARKEREKRIKAELGVKEDENRYIPNVQGQLRKEYEKRKSARISANSAYSIRLFMILIMIFLAAFYIFIKNPEGILKFFGL